jgi:hypothetical protein
MRQMPSAVANEDAVAVARYSVVSGMKIATISRRVGCSKPDDIIIAR